MAARDSLVRDAAERWRLDGWVLLDGLLPADRIAQAYDELVAASAKQPPRPRSMRRADQVDGEIRFRGRQFDGTNLFPLPSCPTLNRLFVHPDLVAFAAAALQSDDLRLYQSRVWSKYGSHTDYEQPLHLDRNHSLVPLVQGGPWGHVEFFVYLHDIDESNGAPMLVPGPEDLLAGVESPRLKDEAPELYGAEVQAMGRAGSVLAYRSDVWHRGVDIPAGAERHVLVTAFRPAAAEWVTFDAHGPLVTNPDFVRFAETCTPDQLALFGIPRPGHEYWTAELVEAMAHLYPLLDLEPWRNAVMARPDRRRAG